MVKRIIPVLLCVYFFFGLAFPAEASIPVDETELLSPSDGGGAYEVNPDAEGWLWISDYWGGEIWRLNPLTGVYTEYITGSTPADARSSGNLFWWVENDSNFIGRALVDTGAFTRWEVPGVYSLYGTALDDSGNLWVSDETQSFIYRLAVNSSGNSGTLCAYSLPDYGMTNYMVFQDPYLLIGDYMNSRLLRLNVDDNTYVWWQLPDNSDPLGMAFDADGDLWYADFDNKLIAELDPDLNYLTTYPTPLPGEIPQMIAIQGKRVWYTSMTDTIGALDTTSADHTHPPVTWEDGFLIPDCGSGPVSPSSSGNLSMYSKNYTWLPRSYDSVLDAGGWRIYQVPTDGTAPEPILFPNVSGIAYHNGKVWVVDNGRQKLVRITAPPETATIQACKRKDADGNMGTSGDRTPLAGWVIKLYKNGSLVSTQATGADGCTKWSELVLGAVYKVVEETRVNWMPLSAVEVSLGTISQSDRYSVEFINYQGPKNVFLPLIRR